MIVLGQDRACVEWLRRELDQPHLDQGPTFKMVDARGALLGVVLFKCYHDNDVQLDIATTSPRWATRAHLRAIFDYPYNQLGCVRTTCVVRWSNAKSHDLVKRLGYKQEGVLRRAYNQVEDTVIYGMLRSECRWCPIKEF